MEKDQQKRLEEIKRRESSFNNGEYPQFERLKRLSHITNDLLLKPNHAQSLLEQ